MDFPSAWTTKGNESMKTRTYLLPPDQTAFKANLHSHSTLSDGVLTPQELKRLYQRHGYSVFAYTDHRAYYTHEELADETFLPIAGYELNFNRRNDRGMTLKTCHINALALEPAKAVPIEGEGKYETQAINDAIRRLRENGFIVNLNHPAWSTQTPEEVLELQGFTAMEVLNSGCSWTYLSPESQLHYEAYLKAGRRILPLYTDDNHASCSKFSPGYKGAYANGAASYPPEAETSIPAQDCCRAYTMIYAPRLDYAAVMSSLIEGRYYCSSGPEIKAYYIEEDRICIDCSPVAAVFLKSMAWALSASQMDIEGRITHAEFDLNRLRENGEGFFRIELLDKNGRTACTNPYYI
jgi:hypothetical protein